MMSTGNGNALVDALITILNGFLFGVGFAIAAKLVALI